MSSKKSKIVFGLGIVIIMVFVLIKAIVFQTSGLDSFGFLPTGFSNSKNLYISIDNDIYQGMGINYKINNLEKGTYEVKITAKEYKHGKFVKEHNLSEETVEHKAKAVPLKVGVNYGDESSYSTFIQTLIKDSYSEEMEIGFFDNIDYGIAFSIIEKDKNFELDKELVIAVYSKGSEDHDIEEIDIYGDYKVSENNEGDLIVFLKLNKVG